MTINFIIDNKIAKKVFNGDFESLPLTFLNILNDKLIEPITKEDLQENYNRSEFIKKGDFKGLLEMKIIAKKIEPFSCDENLYSAFIMEKGRNKNWYIRTAHFINNYMQPGTRYTFNDETNDDIIDRQL